MRFLLIPESTMTNCDGDNRQVRYPKNGELRWQSMHECTSAARSENSSLTSSAIMDRAEALQIIEGALSRSSVTPSGQVNREAYLQEQTVALRACLIDPVQVSAVASDWAQKYCGWDRQTRTMYALAHRGNHWLLFNPESRKFCLADGTDPVSGTLLLTGFSSEDVLAEWLG